MQVHLEVAHDKTNIKRILLQKTTVIGRSTKCNLRVASNGVSRNHCKILVSENKVEVQDLGSSNGTFVDGAEVPKDGTLLLTPGCKLSVGTVDFIVRFKPPVAGKDPGSTVDLRPATTPAAVAATTAVGNEADLGDEETVEWTDSKQPVQELKPTEPKQEIDDKSDDKSDAEADLGTDFEDEIEVEELADEVLLVDGEPQDEVSTEDETVFNVKAQFLEHDDAPEEPEFVLEDPVLETSEADVLDDLADELGFSEEEPDVDVEEAVSEDEPADEIDDNEDEAELEAKKPGKLKSLFGMFGRKSKTEEPTAEEESDGEAEDDAASEAVGVDQEEEPTFVEDDDDQAMGFLGDEEEEPGVDDDDPELGFAVDEDESGGEGDSDLGDFLKSIGQ